MHTNTGNDSPPAWLGLSAPRYTSYPSAHHFSATVGPDEYGAWLDTIGKNTSVSAYIHIPFCRELCWFCGCHTKMTKRHAPIAAYVDLLVREIETLARHTHGRGRLKQIHFGGGSPSLLKPHELIRILYALASAFEFTPPGELAIELDPRTVTPENIAAYREVGINRASIGIQDFHPEVQQAINRVQSYEQVAGVVRDLRSAGIGAINGDLVYGLPHQSANRLRATIEQTLTLEPDRIALFSYAHVPQVKKHQRMIPQASLPSETEKLSLYRMASRMLEEAGYVAIGMDHFAKQGDALEVALREGRLRRNFQGYTADDCDLLLGFGSSSISQFPQGYTQNSAAMPEYRERVEASQFPVTRGIVFTDEDLLRKALIDELMCTMQVDLASLRRRFRKPAGYFAAEIRNLTESPILHPVVSCREEHLCLVTSDRMAARAVAAVFDTHRMDDPARYSKVA